MTRAFLITPVLAALLLTGCADNRPLKTYKFVDSVQNADFDYLMLRNIDKIPTPYPPGGTYQLGDLPITGGQYTLYKFRTEYQGESSEAGKHRFHDILVVKVDNRGKVADAYHYTLEWADNPSLDLYRAGQAGFTLENGVTIDRFALTNPRRQFNERGVLELYVRSEATVFLAKLKELIRWDDRQALADLAHYPLDLKSGKKTGKIKSRPEFLRRYREIFSPAVKSAVLEQQPEDIYADQRGYMIGKGLLWFDDWGQGLRINSVGR
ncbi:MAG: hypothetical protein MUC35_04555 [Candidatus Margulisbacteria bacterium]|jgi:hypothetical protein|nr:hypothetical protein [Candidatus Margulisiibacteriota bacterium]